MNKDDEKRANLSAAFQRIGVKQKKLESQDYGSDPKAFQVPEEASTIREFVLSSNLPHDELLRLVFESMANSMSDKRSSD